MLRLNKVHHIAIICSDYQRSLDFYTRLLGFTVKAENYRPETESFKTDLALNGEYVIELFSFNNPPARVTDPEAAGLRHLAFEVDDIDAAVMELDDLGIAHEAIRTDASTGKHFVFFFDPDHQPLELYEK
ncbi:MAG: VOC family protein [Muribaculaceae bacterium]|nr:VOC family protein [Muribaculaceae bacterium]